jgi:hypothetical protein
LAAVRAIARNAADIRLLNLNTPPRMLQEPDGVKSSLVLVYRDLMRKHLEERENGDHDFLEVRTPARQVEDGVPTANARNVRAAPTQPTDDVR